MNRYQNVAFDRNKSTFVEVSTDAQHQTEASFTSRDVRAKIGSSVIPMVSGGLTLRKQSDAESCGQDCPVTVVESCSFQFSVKQGAASLSALRTELNRLFDEAVVEYHLTDGLVPPVYANFVTE